jgi:hypothetical protein
VRLTAIVLLGVRALIAQSQTNNISGSCDQTINDNRGVITITCSGIDKSLMEQLKKTADVLDHVARRQTDPAILGGLKDLNVKMDEVLSDTRELKTTVVENNRQFAAEQRQKDQAELLRRTPPDIGPFLRIAVNGNLLVMMDCRNLVPFQFKFFITRPDNSVPPGSDGGHMMLLEMPKVYPSPGNTLFNYETNITSKSLAGEEIKLEFYFQSLSYDELRLPGHKGEIITKYQVSPDGTALELRP